MSTPTETLRQVPPFAPPAGFRWLRRGEIVKSTDYVVCSDKKPRLPDQGLVGEIVGQNAADLGDLWLGKPCDIFWPYCRPAPVTPLGKSDTKTGHRPPILGLHFGAWVWYEKHGCCRGDAYPGWFFFTPKDCAGPSGFPDNATHYVEAGDNVNKPAPLRDDQRELRYAAAEKGSAKAAMSADVKSTLLSSPATFGDLHDLVGSIRKAMACPGVPYMEIKYDVSKVPVDPPKKAKLPAHKIPHCPAGWRKLVAGETVLDSDLYWSPDNVWTSRLGTKRVGKPWQLGCRATIRKEGPKTQPVPTVKISTPAFADSRPTSPGDGYRFLGFGERIVYGDQFWSSCTQTWEPAQFLGQIAGAAMYRRKLSDTPLWGVGDLVVLLPTWHGAPNTPASRTNPVWGQPTEPGEKGVYVVGTVTANRAPARESNTMSIFVDWGNGSGCIYLPSDLGRYKEAKLPHWAHPILPDKKPAPQVENALQPPRPTSPGDGYVFLNKGDTIERGDEVWDDYTSRVMPSWRPSSLVGEKADACLFRRKIPAADSPLVPGDGYRLLYDFEVPTDDDEFLNLVAYDSPTDVTKEDRYGRSCWESSRGYYARNSSEGIERGQSTVAERRRGLGNLTPAQFAFRRKLLPGELYLPGWRLLRPDEALKAGDRLRRGAYPPGVSLQVIPDNVREYRTVGEFARRLGYSPGSLALFYRNTSTE